MSVGKYGHCNIMIPRECVALNKLQLTDRTYLSFGGKNGFQLSSFKKSVKIPDLHIFNSNYCKHIICPTNTLFAQHATLLKQAPPTPPSSLALSPSFSPPLSLLQPLFVSLLPIFFFSTHISLSDSRALCCCRELRSLPAISTLHLWNPSWLPRPFTVEGCHLPHGGAGGGGIKRLRRGLGGRWGIWGHSQGHSTPSPLQKKPFLQREL